MVSDEFSELSAIRLLKSNQIPIMLSLFMFVRSTSTIVHISLLGATAAGGGAWDPSQTKGTTTGRVGGKTSA